MRTLSAYRHVPDCWVKKGPASGAAPAKLRHHHGLWPPLSLLRGKDMAVGLAEKGNDGRFCLELSSPASF